MLSGWTQETRMRFASVAEVKDLEDREWRRLGKRRLEKAWEGEEDALYDYL
jgi:hypothetical protein